MTGLNPVTTPLGGPAEPGGATVDISADGRMRVRLSGADPLPVRLEGSYLTPQSKVFVEGAKSRERVEFAPAEGTHAPVFIVTWPMDLDDDLITLFVRDPERDAGRPLIPGISLQRPSRSGTAATRLSWRAEPDHRPFDLKLVSMARKRTALHHVVLGNAWEVPWNRLQSGNDYRVVVRELEGPDEFSPVCELWLLFGEGAFPDEVAQLPAQLHAFRAALIPGDREGEIPAQILELDREGDGPHLSRELGLVLHDTFDGRGGIHARRFAINFPAIEQLATRARTGESGSAHVRDTLEYLALYGVVDKYFRKGGFRDEKYVDRFFSIYDYFDREHAEGLLTELRESPAYRPGSFASSLIEGLVLSTFDRTAAAAAFAHARPANSGLWDNHVLDIGSASYLSGEQVSQRALALSRDRDRLGRNFIFLSAMPRWAPGQHMYLCSCDRVYFSAYYPFWLSIAESLKSRHVSFHFLLNGPPEEIKTLVETAAALRRQLGVLRGDRSRRYADNITFSMVSAPDDLAEPRTFYACSRFLFARRIAQEYQGPLVISDIDLFFREDPKRYLDGLDLDRIGLQAHQGFMTLKPWRRFTAGTLMLPFSERVHEHFGDVEHYLVAGLGLDRSWTLDQNALAYMVERMIAAGDHDLLVDLSRTGARRPTASERIKLLLREEQLRVEAARREREADSRPALGPGS